MDINEILKRARAGEIREWSADSIKLPSGAELRGVRVDGEQDARDFASLLDRLSLPPDMPERIPPVKERGIGLGDAVSAYVGDMKRAKMSEKNVLDTEHTLRLFQAMTPKGFLREVTADDFRAFVDALEVWPANATKRPELAGVHPLEVLKLAKSARGADWPRLAQRTKDKHRDRLAAFFNAQKKLGNIEAPPHEGVLRPRAQAATRSRRRPFTAAELGRIFDPATFGAWATKPHRFWGVVLLAATGARVNEVAQLYVDDVEEVGSVLGIHVRAKHPDQKLKNPSSSRFIPLPAKVLAAGFMDYLADVRAAGSARLFPGLPWSKAAGYGDALSDQFGRYLATLGLQGDGLGCHSFRHAFITTLTHAGHSEHTVREVTGHELDAGAYGHYVNPSSLAARRALVDAYGPPVDFLSPQSFKSALRAASSKSARVERAKK